MDKAQWKMVPVNPTPMMISEGSCASSLPGPHYISESAALKCWQNMLAVSPQPPSASGERDLSQWEKARFGYFDDSGAFQELDMEGPPDFTPGRNARWVGGPYDMQLLRAALAPSPGIDAAEQKPIYQIKFHNDSESTWRDATQFAYDVQAENMRRIVYAAPPAAPPSTEWLAKAECLLDDYRDAIGGGTFAFRHDARAALLAHLKARS